MSRTRKKLNLTRKRTVIIVVLLLICLIAIYTFNFSTKSEVVPKTTMKFSELGTELSVTDDLEFFEDEEGSYIVFPERVSGYQVKQYLVPNVYDIEESKDEIGEENTNTIGEDEISNTITNTDSDTNTTIENEVTNNVLDNNTVNNTVDTNTANENNNAKTNTVTNTTTNTTNSANTTVNENVVLNTTTIEKTAVGGETNTHETSQEVEAVDNENNKTEDDESETSIEEDVEETAENIVEDEVNTNTVADDKKTENTVVENSTVSNNNGVEEKSETPAPAESSKEDSSQESNQEEVSGEELQTKELSNVIYYDESAERDLEDVNIEGMTSYKPGDKVYFSKEDIDSNSMEITVIFKTIRINGVDLYNQELIEDTGISIIKITGYIPAEFKLEVNADDKERIEELKSDVDELKDTTVLVAYDIKIKKDDVEYQPMNYFQAVDVSICSPTEFENNLINNEVTILHIKENIEDNEIIFEKVAVDTKTEDTVECRTNEFSTYAVVKNNNRTEDAFTVYDFDSDYNYYTGKSIVERQCTYPSVYEADGSNQKLAKFTVNYYSYNSNKSLTTDEKLEKTTEYTISANTNYTDNPGEYDYVIGYETNPPYSPIYGYRSYTRTYTVNFTLNLVNQNYVDTSKAWSLTFDVPDNIIVASLSENGLSGVDYNADAGTLTLSGNNMNNWTRNSLTQYTFSYQVPFNIMKEDHTGFNNMSFPVSNINYDGVKRLLVGHISNREKDNNIQDDYGERQTLMTYVIAVPVNTSNGTASIELIDNPFMDRPSDFGFNGWTVNDQSTPISFATNITTDNQTFIQTLNISGLSYTEGASYTIDLNADWEVANVIYVRTGNGSSNGDGLTPNTPTNSIANAITWMNNAGYKTSDTVSDRELNILVLIGGTLNLSAPSKAITITSLDSGNDYRGNATLSVNNNISLSNDLQIDFVSMSDTTGTSLYSESLTSTDHAIICNNRNLRIGRGMMESASNRFTVAQISGGTNGNDNSNSRRFKLVTETGRYELISVGAISGISNAHNTHNGIEVVGCDFDRINNNNEDFYIYCRLMTKSAGGSGRVGGNYVYYSYSYPLNADMDLYKVIVKSGTIGTDYFANNFGDDDSDYPYCGIYIGGAQTQYGYDYGKRTLIVEGGNIANINGGLKVDPNNKVDTYIYVKGGTVANITAGAGRTATYGDRYVCVTGGTIRYSVNGGSNGMYANASNTGTLGGSTYVYVGGNATIGGESEVSSESTLYGVLAGSVLGAGNGNTNYKGSVDSTHVVIDGNATVNGNVFGGGNFGVVGASYNASTDFTPTPIKYHNITQASSLNTEKSYLLYVNNYLINRNGRSLLSNVEYIDNISNYMWEIEPSGSGTYYIKNQSTNEYVNNGGRNFALNFNTTNKLELTYSGGIFSYRNTSDGNTYYLIGNTNGLALNRNANNAVRLYESTDIDDSEPITTDVGTTKAQIDIYGGTIKKDVYGGSNQSDVYGTTVINMSADSKQTIYEAESNSIVGAVEGIIYGGSNVSGVIHSSTVININSGTIGTVHTANLGNYDAVFGGGRGYNTTVNGNTVVNITDEKGNVTINGCVYGGSEQGIILLNDNVYVGDNKSEDNAIALNGNVYGGGKGSNTSGNVHSASTGGSSIVKVDGGTYNNSTNGVTQVYGGCNVLGTIGGKIKVEIGKNYSTDVYQVYGGGNQAEVTNSTSGVDVELYKNATVKDAFNGGNSAGITGTQTTTPRIIHADGAKVENIYGGSNTEGDLTETHVLIENGAEVRNAYGGGLGEDTNISGDTEVIVKGYDAATLEGDPSLTNTKITHDVYGGGSDGTVGGNTSVKIENSEVQHNVYGGGYGELSSLEDPLATVSGDANVEITGSTIGNNVYGSGYGGKVNGSTTVAIETTNVTGNVFGGGQGATAFVGEEANPASTSVTIIGSGETKSTANNVFGGGDFGKVFGNTIVTTELSTVNQSIYGGGNEADVTGTTSVTLQDNTIVNDVYGGGNKGLVGESTFVGIYEDSVVSNNVYGGGNQGDVTELASVEIDNSLVKNNVFGGGQSADVDWTTVIIKDGLIGNSVYGGGDQGEVKNTSGGTNATKVTINNTTIVNTVYGGGNGTDDPVLANTQGKVNGNTSLTITGSVVGTTATGEADPDDEGAVAIDVNGEGNVFGAGCGSSATVTGNTTVKINNTSIKNDIYCGGNNGSVSGSTDVELNKATIGGSAYAAGNGENAVTGVGTHIAAHNKTQIAGNIFGGGNAALTGNYTSGSVVDIAGAIIGGNVYGSSNQSAIYGDAIVNIGINAVDDYHGTPTGYTKSKILITGTVYGGGEQMDPSKPYNFDTVSVEGNITITIDGTGYDTSETDTIDILGSIFGSGNASRAGLPNGTDDQGKPKYIQNNGNVIIRNYGSASNVKSLVSIQRAGEQNKNTGVAGLTIDNQVLIDNSYISISGTQDSTSIHPRSLFTLNRIGMLKIKNGTVLYLDSGSNVLENFQSLYGSDGSEVPAAVKIKEDGTIDADETNVINRLYMHEGTNLNVAKNENVSIYGGVVGMTFFGLYKEKGADPMYTGMYTTGYSPTGTYISFDERNFAEGYVEGLHYYDDEGHDIHDIEVDGFYTVYENFTIEEPDPTVEITSSNYSSFGAVPYFKYITPTPEEDVYYDWYCGPSGSTKYYTVTLISSKYSTLGVQELPLNGISYSNATVYITNVESYLEDENVLIKRSDILNVNPDEDKANTEFALVMKTGNTGWSMNGSTNFYSKPNADYDPDDPESLKMEASWDGYGDRRNSPYLIENSTVTPSLNFYLYSSNNITEEKTIGKYNIEMEVEYKINDMTKGHTKIIIACTLLTKLYEDSGFNAAITPGKQFDIFTSTATHITSDSSFSTYFELAEPNFSQYLSNKGYTEFYEDSYRVITTDFAFPANTTITMIDLSNSISPKYYYYIVSDADAAAGKTTYRLDTFKEMGSTDKLYDESNIKDTYRSGDDFEYESFIFISDFANADFGTSNHVICENQLFRMYLNSEVTVGDETNEETLMGMLDDQILQMNYSIYNAASTIGVNASLTDDRVYIGSNTELDVNTVFQVVINESIRIHDTKYYDQKLGVKLTLYKLDSEGNYIYDDLGNKVQVSGSELLGAYFTVNGENYYPRADGTTRIKIAEKVSNASTPIIINTGNSSLNGKYEILIESFGSPDGVYYGIESSASTTVKLSVIDALYGLDAHIPEEQVIIDMTSGYTSDLDGYISKTNKNVDVTVDYSSVLSEPLITVSLFRRQYDEDNPVSLDYNKVDLQDYVTESLVGIDTRAVQEDPSAEPIPITKIEYYAFTTPELQAAVDADETPESEDGTQLDVSYTLKNSLVSGTYKLVYTLYDHSTVDIYIEETDTVTGETTMVYDHTNQVYNYIGDTFVYIVIK